MEKNSNGILTDFVMASIQQKKSKAGKKTYYVVVSAYGKRKWIKAGSVKDARILKKKVESLAESERIEKLGIVPRDKRIDDLFQEYLDYARLRTAPNSVKRYKAVLNTFLTFLQMFHPGIRYISQVKPEHIESYQQKRLESIELKQKADAENPFCRKEKLLPKPQTVNYEVGILRSAFIWAYDRELVSSVTTKKVKPLRSVPKKEARILSPEECKEFLKTARNISKTNRGMLIYYRAFRFLLNTGLRSGELCNLTWDDIDLQTGLIKVRAKPGWTPKSYSREFFMNRSALTVLAELDKNGFVFKDLSGRQLDNDRLRNALIKITKAAGFKDLTRVHDLRHTFNSIMQMNGVDPATMGRILGHKDIETTMIYTHQTQEHLKRSIEKINVK